VTQGRDECLAADQVVGAQHVHGEQCGIAQGNDVAVGLLIREERAQRDERRDAVRPAGFVDRRRRDADRPSHHLVDRYVGVRPRVVHALSLHGHDRANHP